jgi:hypothetical protein
VKQASLARKHNLKPLTPKHSHGLQALTDCRHSESTRAQTDWSQQQQTTRTAQLHSPKRSHRLYGTLQRFTDSMHAKTPCTNRLQALRRMHSKSKTLARTHRLEALPDNTHCRTHRRTLGQRGQEPLPIKGPRCGLATRGRSRHQCSRVRWARLHTSGGQGGGPGPSGAGEGGGSSTARGRGRARSRGDPTLGASAGAARATTQHLVVCSASKGRGGGGVARDGR